VFFSGLSFANRRRTVEQPSYLAALSPSLNSAEPMTEEDSLLAG
jgi:hypothetical protein